MPNAVTLLLATVILIALNLVPWMHPLLYPAALFVTFVHESCHGLAAMLTGGAVASITVNPDGSGVTWTSGGSRFLTVSAGYFGTLLVGVVCTSLLKHGTPHKVVLGVMGGILIFALAHAGLNPFMMFWGAVLLTVVAFGVFTRLGEVLAALLALQLLLGAFYDLSELWSLTTSSGALTDAALMSEYTGLPATFWVVAWLGASVATTWALLKPRASA